MIEQQIVDEGSTEILGVEKQARALSLLVRDFEKLSGIHAQLSGPEADPTDQSGTAKPDTAADAEAWRDALARRLERLCQTQNT